MIARVVLQKLSEEHTGGDSPFLLRLGGHSKQVGDEGDLPGDVSLVHPLHLSFANHVHGLISSQGPPRALEGKEAHPRLDQPLDKTVVLLHHITELFDLVSRSTCSGSAPVALRSAMALG